MSSGEEEPSNIFAGIYEPFSGLNELDYDTLGIYMDHEPENEYVTTMDKCQDSFLNILLSDDNLRNSGMCDEVRAKMFEGNLYESDEEGEEPVNTKYRMHDPTVRWDKMVPKVGDIFENPAQLKFCVANYAVSNGYQLYFEKCDSTRVVARCGKRSDEENVCPYRLHAAWMYDEKSFQIKTLNDTHTCSRRFSKFGMVTPEWIGRHYMSEIANKPKIKLREMIAEIRQKFRCEVSIGQCRRAKQWAKELIEGKLAEHYARIWDYAHELIRSNPGSTCKVGVSVNPDGINYFHRFYICFKALKDGWKRTCRKVIGLDGCFLKGEVKGELLTAIGRDANNQVYPIAWAVVDVENKPNWSWFLDLLHDDLDLDGGRGLVVISDQHKGLLEAVKTFLPNVQHRQCARHIFQNFRKSYRGAEYKKMFWAASMSCVLGDFNRQMLKIKASSPGAYEHLMSKQPASWCRAFFEPGYACEAVENGVTECFNAIIVEARNKPLITMLEEIRLYIMERSAYNAKECTKWKTNICPAVIKKMNLFGKHVSFWKIVHSQGNVFEARRGCSSYKVDLDARVCACRLWELSGIPCVHAIGAIQFIHEKPENYISDWFSKKKFIECYSSNLEPVNGSNIWPQTEFIKPLPPLTRKMPGRPKTKRRRAASENDSKFGSTSRVSAPRTVKCGKCLQYGHNQKGCNNEKVIPTPMAPKKTGRPRKHPVGQQPLTKKRKVATAQPSASNVAPSTTSKLPVNRGGKTAANVNTRKTRPAKNGTKSTSGKTKRKRTLGLVDEEEILVSQVLDEGVGINGSEGQNGVDVAEGQTGEGTNAPMGQNGVDVVEGQNGEGANAPMGQNDGETEHGEGDYDFVSQLFNDDGEMGPVEKVGQDLRSTVSEIGAGINEILGENGSDNEEAEPEFNEGDANDILPTKVHVDAEDVASMLEAGYTMAEIEGMRGIQLDLDDLPPVELDLNVADAPTPEGEVDEDEHRDAVKPNKASLPKLKVRRPSERILKQKLKKKVVGVGATPANPVDLE